MACRLVQNIKHSLGYDAGGIKEILLLDINDFVSYQFAEDKLYDRCYVESIKVAAKNYIHFDTVSQNNFVESFDNGVYTQKLTMYIRSLDHTKTSNLLKAKSNKYVVAFRTMQNKCFVFGSDGGASVNFNQQSGQLSEGSGYSIVIEKLSVFPLFEINIEHTYNIYKILATESLEAITTEDSKTISITL